MAQRLAVIAAFAVTTVGLVGCGGSSSGGTTTGGAPIKVVHTPKPKPKPKPASPTGTPSATSTDTPTPMPTVTVTVTGTPTKSSATASAKNLPANSATRTKLVKAGAASHQLPAADYTGLVPGETYYAYYPKTATYWAGAGLVPSSSSTDAQVSVQDDGSYLVFFRHASGSWTAYNVGLAGIAGSRCSVTVPAAVLTVWHWKANSCRPPS
jgi:hypothetical protein